ncbi:hypothetical protein KY308_02320 [Candidatus Woesearchaeota archaeon]|nr:hypothetical protein [Candidatus Woesearchaeota archaeon]
MERTILFLDIGDSQIREISGLLKEKGYTVLMPNFFEEQTQPTQSPDEQTQKIIENRELDAVVIGSNYEALRFLKNLDSLKNGKVPKIFLTDNFGTGLIEEANSAGIGDICILNEKGHSKDLEIILERHLLESNAQKTTKKEDSPILIVDHNNIAVGAIRASLEKAGFNNITKANSLEEASEILGIKDNPEYEGELSQEIVISGMYFPGERSNGLAFLKKVKKLGCETILLNSKKTTETAQQAVTHGIEYRQKKEDTNLANHVIYLLERREKIGRYISGELPEGYSGRIWIVTGSYCAGKTDISQALVNQINGLSFATRYTDRPKRENEKWVFRFVDEKEFTELQGNGKFQFTYGHAGHRYGQMPIDLKGKDIIATPDFMGYEEYRAHFQDNTFGIYIFSLEDDLKKRLKGKECCEEEKNKRMRMVKKVAEEYEKFAVEGAVFPFDAIYWNKNPNVDYEGFTDELYAKQISSIVDRIMWHIADYRRSQIDQLVEAHSGLDQVPEVLNQGR